MRVLIATDAWHPQVNGVVRTLTSLAASARALGVAVDFLTPEGFPSFALADLSEPASGAAEPARDRAPHQAAAPDAIHIATEGTIGSCRARLLPAPRPAVHDELHDAVSRIHLGALADSGILELRGAAPLPRRRDRDHGLDAVADGGAAAARLPESRHVDARRRHRSVQRRIAPSRSDLPRPIFVTVGRVAVEKNLEAFLSLDLPGTKVVIGDGPQEAELQAALPARRSSSACCRGPRARRPSGGGRRVRVPEPDRHVRRRAARGAGLRRAGRRLPGDRPEGRDRRTIRSAC